LLDIFTGSFFNNYADLRRLIPYLYDAYSHSDQHIQLEIQYITFNKAAKAMNKKNEEN